jgi:hypothetical protein
MDKQTHSKFLLGANKSVPTESAPPRRLTPGEVRLIEGIFGDEIDTSKIEVHSFPLNPRREGQLRGSALDNTANFYGGDTSPDFSTEGTLSDFKSAGTARLGVFLHEMTHVLQGQHGELKNRPKPPVEIPQNVGVKQWLDPGYGYYLDGKKHLGDYGTEQQAAIMEDYAAHFLTPQHPFPYRQKYEFWDQPDMARDMARLKDVVEERFPKARETRLAFEAAEAAAKHAPEAPEKQAPAAAAPPRPNKNPDGQT